MRLRIRWLVVVGGLLTGFVGRGYAAAPLSAADSLRALVRQAALPDRQRVLALEGLCRLYGTPGLDPDSALLYGEQAATIARRGAQPKLLLDVLNTLGTTYARAHRMSAALRVFLEELRVAQRARLPRYESLAEVALGNIYADDGEDHPQAEAHYRLAIRAAIRGGFLREQAKAEGLYGSFLLERNRYPEASTVIRHAVATYAQIGDRAGQGAALSYLAESALMQQDYAAAITAARQALDLLPTTDTYALASLYDLLCRTALAQGQTAAAITYGQQAVAFAAAAQVPATEMDVLTNLVSAYAAERNYAAAYPLLQRQLALREVVFRQESADEVNRLLAQFEAEKKQQAIRTLTQRSRIQALKAQRQEAQFRLLATGAGGLLLALLVGGGLYWQLSRSRRRLAISEASLRDLNGTKDLLMTIIGHDLRGPVAAFQHVGAILHSYAQQPDPAELRALGDEIADDAGRLGTLLDNLLHWGRAQAGQVMSHPVAVDATTVVTAALALHRPTATNRRIALVADVPVALPFVWADPALLGTVLRNLVGNAVKFTPAGGRVTVQVRNQTSDRVQFVVADTGVGITPEQLGTLFEPGRARSTPDATTGEVGTGLGLAVCWSFVQLLGGELRATSTPGAGTQLTFEVPTAAAQQAETPYQEDAVKANIL
jgi:signal transduction histidine kinase